MPNLKHLGCCGLILVLAAGCGTDPVKHEEVQGRVFFGTEPLHGGTIVFTPDAERGNEGPMASAEIQPDGRFILHTGQEPGAVPGWHRVTIAPGPDGQSLPRKYCDPKLSDQAREVKSGQTNAFDFNLN